MFKGETHAPATAISRATRVAEGPIRRWITAVEAAPVGPELAHLLETRPQRSEVADQHEWAQVLLTSVARRYELRLQLEALQEEEYAAFLLLNPTKEQRQIAAMTLARPLVSDAEWARISSTYPRMASRWASRLSK
jgi:hypothetical protein